MKRLWVITGILLTDLLTAAAKATTYLPPEDPQHTAAIALPQFLIPALLIFVPIATYRHLKKRSRRKRGLCVKCAYDLRGFDHEACPECGVSTSHARQ